MSAGTEKTECLAGQRTGEIRVPTLIVTAEHDYPACFEIAGLLERTVQGARKIVVPGAGHVINMECPDEFNRIVLGFLADVVSRSASFVPETFPSSTANH